MSDELEYNKALERAQRYERAMRGQLRLGGDVPAVVPESESESMGVFLSPAPYREAEPPVINDRVDTYNDLTGWGFVKMLAVLLVAAVVGVSAVFYVFDLLFNSGGMVCK